MERLLYSRARQWTFASTSSASAHAIERTSSRVRVIAKIYIAGEDLEGEKPNRSSSVNFSAANRSQTRESFLWKLKLITFRQSCFLLSSLSFSFPFFYCSFTKKFLLPCLHLIARNSAVKGGRRVFPFLEFWIIIAQLYKYSSQSCAEIVYLGKNCGEFFRYRIFSSR